MIFSLLSKLESRGLPHNSVIGLGCGSHSDALLQMRFEEIVPVPESHESLLSSQEQCADIVLLVAATKSCHESRCAVHSTRYTLYPILWRQGSRVSSSNQAFDLYRPVGTIQHLCLPLLPLPMGRLMLHGEPMTLDSIRFSTKPV